MPPAVKTPLYSTRAEKANLLTEQPRVSHEAGEPGEARQRQACAAGPRTLSAGAPPEYLRATLSQPYMRPEESIRAARARHSPATTAPAVHLQFCAPGRL